MSREATSRDVSLRSFCESELGAKRRYVRWYVPYNSSYATRFARLTSRS